MAKKNITPRHRQSRGPYDFVPTAERNILGMQDMDLLARPHTVEQLCATVPTPSQGHERDCEGSSMVVVESAAALVLQSSMTGERF